MACEEFRESLLEQVRLSSSAEGTTDKEEFLKCISEMLLEAEVIDDAIEFLPFEGIGHGQRKIQIDGYTYNELDDVLCLYVIPPLSYIDIQTLTNTEATRYFNRARSFIEDADFIVKNAEESAPAYGLAVDILNRYSDIRKYNIYILTDKVMSKNIHTMTANPVNNKEIECHIWDITRLKQLDESKNGKEDIVIDLTQYTKYGIPCLTASNTDDYTAYLCNIPGIVLATLYNNYGSRLLEGNVRSFLQTKGKVNKGIRNTILNNPDMFFAYNNGIAATAYSLKTANHAGTEFITEITALQIVNGGQTTASLATSLIKDKKDDAETKIERIYVPMKLSIVSPEKAQELIPYISRYANSQNKVSEADLWSNHPFHIRMEGFSRRIVAPATGGRQYGTHWYYERANGQYKQETYKSTDAERKRFEMQNPKLQMFTKTDLAKYFNIRRELPQVASTGGQKSFAKFAEWAASQWEKDQARFNETFFRNIVSLTIIFRQADRLVKSQPWYNSYKANIVAYTISKIIYTVRMNYPDCAVDYRSIWNRQGLSEAWENQIKVLSKIIYEFLIDDNRQVENVTEWAKRDQCWELAKKLDILLEPDFVKELIYKSNEKEEQSNAKQEQRLEDKVNFMIAVEKFGVENWRELLKWDETHVVLSSEDKSFINAALIMEKGQFPSEKQCKIIMKVLEKARQEGFPK